MSSTSPKTTKSMMKMDKSMMKKMKKSHTTNSLRRMALARTLHRFKRT